MTHQNDIEPVVAAFVSMIATVFKLRDVETWGHMQRCRQKSKIYLKLIFDNHFENLILTEEEKLTVLLLDVNLLSDLIMVHDIGKLGIPENVINKPGRYTQHERTIAEQHPLLGESMVVNQFTEKRRDHALLKPMIKSLMQIVGSHHERWDGNGYPRKLKGSEIPFLGRLTNIIDVQDALRHYRQYKDSWPAEKVREYMEQQSGQNFDPELLKYYLSLYDQIEEIDVAPQKDEAMPA